MPVDSSDVWPTHPDDLVAIVVANKDRSKVNRALGDLDPIIQEVFDQLSTQFRRHPFLKNFDGALMAVYKVLPKYKGERVKNGFRYFCRKVLFRLALSDIRRKREVGRIPDGYDTPAEPDAWDPEIEICRRADALGMIEEVMQPKKIDYFAVLLLQFRLAALNRSANGYRNFSPADAERMPDFRCAEFVEWAFPWTATQSSRRVYEGLPNNAKVWSAVKAGFNDQAGFTATDLCQLISGISGNGFLTEDCWYQWVQRAKSQARSIIESEEWDQLFAGLLRDHDPRDDSQGAEVR